MKGRARPGWLLGAAALLLGAPVAAAPCAPARISSDTSALPPPWRAALEELVEATTHADRPWSCGGARLALFLDAEARSARLVVTAEDWPALEREVQAPEEVVPTGKALLARPTARRATPAVPEVAPAGVPAPPERVQHAPLRPASAAPRLLIDALAETRYSGHVNGVWAGGVLRVTVPFDRWSFGVWARYEQGVAVLQQVPVDFDMSSGCVGITAGYRFLDGPVQLAAAFEPSLAIVSMDGGVDNHGESEGARGDVRLGARLAAALPFGARWRALLALDGEISPGAMASAKHRQIAADLPPIPSFTLGASLGGELVIR